MECGRCSGSVVTPPSSTISSWMDWRFRSIHPHPLRRSVRSINTFFTEVRQTLVPRGEVKHGPLPPLLVAMTLVTGLVDAFSYLVLGHVFVANMTGNVVFLAFALAGAAGFSILASLVALCSFVLGSFGGGLLGSRLAHHRALLFTIAAPLQTLFLIAPAVLAPPSRH